MPERVSSCTLILIYMRYSLVLLHFAGLYFLVKWLDEGDNNEQLLDVLPSKSVRHEEHDVLDIVEGTSAEANFGGRWYSVKIIGKGNGLSVNFWTIDSLMWVLDPSLLIHV